MEIKEPEKSLHFLSSQKNENPNGLESKSKKAKKKLSFSSKVEHSFFEAGGGAKKELRAPGWSISEK